MRSCLSTTMQPCVLPSCFPPGSAPQPRTHSKVCAPAWKRIGARSWRVAERAPAPSSARKASRAANRITSPLPLLLQQDEVPLQVADDAAEVLLLLGREVPAGLVAQHHQVVDDALGMGEVGLAFPGQGVLDHAQ